MNTTRQHFDDAGHLTAEGVALFVDALKLGVVTQVPEDIRDHVAGCTDCKKRITGVIAVLRDEDYSSVKRHPVFTLEGSASEPDGGRGWRIAAAIGGVAIAAALMYYLAVRTGGETGTPAKQPTTQAHPETVVVVPQAAAPTSPDDATYASSFTPDPGYEALVSAGTRSSSITEATPANGTTQAMSGIVFTWKEPEPRALRVVVMNNKGTDVWTSTPGRSPLTLSSTLLPGLYYWKLVDGEEALYVGKFMVR